MQSVELGCTTSTGMLSKEKDVLLHMKVSKASIGTKLKSFLVSKIPSLHHSKTYAKLSNKLLLENNLENGQFSVDEDAYEEEQRMGVYDNQDMASPSIDYKVKVLQTLTKIIATVFFVAGALSLSITAFMVIPVFVVPVEGAGLYMLVWAGISVILLALATLLVELNWYSTERNAGDITCRLSCCLTDYQQLEPETSLMF